MNRLKLIRKRVIAFFFYFDQLGELPRIETIKNCVKQIALLGDRISVPLSDIDDKLADEVEKLSYDMFCHQKRDKKTFTVSGNKLLRAMRIPEDADGFNEKENLVLSGFFRNNLEVFAELISRSYLPKPNKNAKRLPQLFFAEIYSCYSGDKQPVFFVEINDELFVFKDQTTEIKLEDYISDYFSATKDVRSIIEPVKKEIFNAVNTFAQAQRVVFKEFEKFNADAPNRYGFISGAITFLDFLGWKGLWQSQTRYKDGHNPLAEVSNLISDFREKLDQLSQELFVQAQGIPLSSLISISDTIAIFTPKVSVVNECHLLELHSKLSKYILEQCASRKYAIRGAITFGEYSIMNNIMIGPGIDECASWHEMGNWIGVHLTPSAQIYWDDCVDSASDTICRYKPVLKNGLSVDYCVKWRVTKEILNNLALYTKALLPEISGKYINTYKFFKEVVWKEDNNGEN